LCAECQVHQKVCVVCWVSGTSKP